MRENCNAENVGCGCVCVSLSVRYVCDERNMNVKAVVKIFLLELKNWEVQQIDRH